MDFVGTRIPRTSNYNKIDSLPVFTVPMYVEAISTKSYLHCKISTIHENGALSFSMDVVKVLVIKIA